MFTVVLVLLGLWLESWSDDRPAFIIALAWSLATDVVVGLHVWHTIYPT